MRKYLGALTALLVSGVPLTAVAVELNADNYVIYTGDLNNDGMKDFYFHGKESTQIVPGASPLLLAAPPSFIIYREADAYGAAAIFSLTNAQITTHITQGKLRQALVSDAGLAEGIDVLFWRDELNGFTSVLLRGADAASPALLLATSSADLPLVAGAYTAQPGRPNLSDPTIGFSLSDINGDGRRDLAANGQVYLSNFAGLLSDKTYSTDQMAAGPIIEEYFYDDLGRLERVESTDGGIQAYHHDREDNRTSVNKTKSI